MLVGIAGIVMVLWAIWAGMGTRENNRAMVFQGPAGTLLNIVAVVIGAVMIFTGFW